MRIVRNHRLFESSSTNGLISKDVNILARDDMNTNRYRIAAVCRILRNILTKYNDRQKIPACTVSITGTIFTKGEENYTVERLFLDDALLDDKRYIRLNSINIKFEFYGPVVIIEDVISAMDIISAIVDRFALNIEPVYVGKDSATCVKFKPLFSGKNKLNKNNIVFCYNLFNKDNPSATPGAMVYQNFCKYDGLDDDTRRILEATGYDFSKHDIYMKTKNYLSGDGIITLRVPFGKTVTDTEISRVCRIFENYVYPDVPSNKISFYIRIAGTLIAKKGNPEWMLKPENKVFIDNLVNNTGLADEEYLKQVQAE